MTYQVKLLPRAKRQLYESALWWADNRSTEQAVRWLEGFEAALEQVANRLARTTFATGPRHCGGHRSLGLPPFAPSHESTVFETL